MQDRGESSGERQVLEADTLPPTPRPLPPFEEDPARDFVGREIAGRYRIERLLARGAMGHVYAGVQLPFGRGVAVKVLHPREEDDEEQRFAKRFRREAAIAAQLAHPNIVTIFDYGETEAGELFIAMEHVAGRSLLELLREEGPLPARRALGIGLQVARALRKAHGAGVMHRDLKPANLMVLTDRDGVDFVKILDFGLVKLFASEEEAGDDDEDSGISDAFSDDQLTSAGAMLGTPGYMAPEQAVGDEVDGRTDIYALGVLLFEMITGRLPFDAGSVVELVTQQVMRPVPTMRSVAPEADCPPEIEELVARCLQKHKSARFGTADELLAAMKGVWRLVTDESFGTEAGFALPLAMSPPRRAEGEAPGSGAASRGGGERLQVLRGVAARTSAPSLAPAPAAPPEVVPIPVDVAPRPAGLWLAGAALALVLIAGLVVIAGSLRVEAP